MRKQAALLATIAATLWGAVAVSVWTHVRGPANAALIGAAATATLGAVIILANRWNRDENRKRMNELADRHREQMDHLADRLGLLLEHSELTGMLRQAEKLPEPDPQDPAPKRRSVRATDTDGATMIIGVEDGTPTDIDGVREAIRQQRHHAAS